MSLLLALLAAGVVGDASVTEADDTLSATGSVTLFGSASITESDDTVSATGYSGDLAPEEGRQPGGGYYLEPIIIDERKKRTEPEPEPIPELTEADLAAFLAELQAPALMQDQIAAALEAVRAQIMAEAQSAELQGLAVAALEAISADEAENELLLLAA